MTFDPFKQARLMNGFQKMGSVSISEQDTSVDELKALAGIREDTESYGASISQAATNKAQIQREQNIRPGTEAWFKLWFAEPKLTGEQPFDGKR